MGVLDMANRIKRENKSHLITFNSGQHSSLIDFVLTRREERPNCMDCKVIPGECVITQHKLLTVDFHFQERSGESSNGMFLRCLRIELLRKGRGMKVRMRIICGRR
jgi:hypothetical protein